MENEICNYKVGDVVKIKDENWFRKNCKYYQLIGDEPYIRIKDGSYSELPESDLKNIYGKQGTLKEVDNKCESYIFTCEDKDTEVFSWCIESVKELYNDYPDYIKNSIVQYGEKIKLRDKEWFDEHCKEIKEIILLKEYSDCSASQNVFLCSGLEFEVKGAGMDVGPYSVNEFEFDTNYIVEFRGRDTNVPFWCFEPVKKSSKSPETATESKKKIRPTIFKQTRR